MGLASQDLLAQLYKGNDDYGGYGWGNLGDRVTATVAQAIGPPPNASPTAVVTLNDNLNGLWFGSTGLQQGQTLLHELGHVYQFLYGPQTTAIAGPDGNINNPTQLQNQNNNNALISQNCAH